VLHRYVAMHNARVADDFRTFEWEKAFPEPELAMKEIKQLLALI